jgi:hypothetical protein
MAKHLISSNATITAVKEGDPRSRLNAAMDSACCCSSKAGRTVGGFECTFDGRRKTLSFGTYPDTTLSLARKKADEARQQVRSGVDPSDLRKAAKEASERRRTDDRRAEEVFLPSIRSRRLPASGTRRTRPTGQRPTRRRSSGVLSATSFRGSAGRLSHRSGLPTYWSILADQGCRSCDGPDRHGK